MRSIIKLSIVSKPMGPMDEILNNEKQVVLLLKAYISIQLNTLVNKEAGLLTLVCFLSHSQLTKSEYKY